MSPWVRAGRCLAAITLGTLILAPLIPGPHAGPLNDLMKRISIQQSWRMYTPDPQRAQSYISVTAELEVTGLPCESCAWTANGPMVAVAVAV